MTASQHVSAPDSPDTSTTSRANATARRAANSRWVDRFARLGFAARGLVYVVVGGIAITIATGGGHHSADRQGALRTVAQEPFGRVLVVVAIIGFVGYALWQLTEAVWGHRDEDGARRTLQRLGSVFNAVLYGAFAVSSIRLLAGSGGGSSDKTSRTWTARLLGEPSGRYLVVAAGIGFVVAGAVLAWRGVATKFEDSLDTASMSTGVERTVATLGLAGHVARGVVFALVGAFLIDAAVTFDPHKARGLDGSLKALAQNTWGTVALVLVAVGLLAFGLFSFAEARYRRT